MTAPNGDLPGEGGYYAGGSGVHSLTDYNTLDEETAKARMQAGLSGSYQRQRSGFASFLGSLADAFQGLYTGPSLPLAVISDGMTTLNGRVELLDDVPGYAGAYMLNNHRFGSGSSWKTIPFNGKYGPSKKAQLNTSTHRMELDKGSWSVHFTVSTGSGTVITGIGHAAQVQVRDHTGAVVITRIFEWQNGGATWDQHFALPVIATEDGWTVEVAYRHSGNWWSLLGGTERTVLWVERKNLDTTNAGTTGPVPDGPDIS